MSTEMKEGPGAWLIRKGASFYRPNRSGYTHRKEEAGRFTEAEAKREASVEPWHMSAMLADDVPDVPHVHDVLGAEIARLSKEVERLKALASRWEHQSGVNLSGYEEEKDCRRRMQARAEAAEAEATNLKERLGLVRVCVNCERTADAEKVKRGDELPECVNPEGLSACTFDLTPPEALEHWRKVAHERQARVKVLEEALGPFEDFGHLLELETEGFEDEDTLDLTLGGSLMVTFTHGDFRRARAAAFPEASVEENDHG